MFQIGASLAAARQARGLSLADAEQLTCIRAKQLAALESESFDRLPGRTYARAFLRSYAAALGLEADRFVEAFEELVPEPVEEPAPVRRPRRPLPRVRPALIGAAVLAVIAIAAWTGSSHNSPTSPLAALPPPAASQHQVREAGGVLGAHTTITKPPPAGLVIRATRGDCWLLVRAGGPTGAILYERTLRQGDVVRFSAPRVWVRLGAPGMVDVSRAGKPVAVLSGPRPVNVVV